MNDLKNIKSMIFEVRGYQVMLDADLAEIYQVETKRLNEAVKRNIGRFPPEFMFQLTKDEYENLRSQFVTSKNATSSLRSQFATSKNGKGGRRYLPFAFTEHGVYFSPNIITRRHKGTEKNRIFASSFVSLCLGVRFFENKYTQKYHPPNNSLFPHFSRRRKIRIGAFMPAE
jgi:hypothetical protein